MKHAASLFWIPTYGLAVNINGFGTTPINGLGLSTTGIISMPVVRKIATTGIPFSV
jgi:hypothetical protein